MLIQKSEQAIKPPITSPPGHNPVTAFHQSASLSEHAMLQVPGSELPGLNPGSSLYQPHDLEQTQELSICVKQE